MHNAKISAFCGGNHITTQADVAKNDTPLLPAKPLMKW